MERDNVGALALAVCLLCCVVGGAASAYSEPADPRHPTWQPSPGPVTARRGYYQGPAASPRQYHHGISPAPASSHYSAPAPTAGSDDLPSLPPPVYTRAPEPQQTTTTPHFGFPLEPTVGVASARPAGAPASGEGYPFIGSNPTVPLPTGVTDTATVRPLPDTGSGHADADGKVVGRAAAPVRARAAMIGLLVVFTSVMLSSCSWSS
ncbi:skin secretory protein xP2-like [Lolium rigidum]|uniref:skin secretory protein xP2-like n=1 Tax=Lolium rigidum TaxID=89674 RepID=UPI001F5D0DC7|nr:skin secretory protein xP2-like [Lolium rigidum]